MTLSGIEPATFRFVAQHLNHCATANIINKHFESLDQLKYLQKNKRKTSQNSGREEIKSRLRSRSACYHPVQNLLSSSLLSKNLKIKTYRTIILPVVLCEYITRSLTWREDHGLRKIFGLKMAR